MQASQTSTQVPPSWRAGALLAVLALNALPIAGVILLGWELGHVLVVCLAESFCSGIAWSWLIVAHRNVTQAPEHWEPQFHGPLRLRGAPERTFAQGFADRSIRMTAAAMIPLLILFAGLRFSPGELSATYAVPVALTAVAVLVEALCVRRRIGRFTFMQLRAHAMAVVYRSLVLYGVAAGGLLVMFLRPEPLPWAVGALLALKLAGELWTLGGSGSGEKAEQGNPV